MDQADMRENWPTEMQLWREMAHLSGALQTGNDRSVLLCKSLFVDRPPSNRSALHCQYRYPSPRRSGPIWARPTPLLRQIAGDLRLFRRCIEKTLVLPVQTADSVRKNTKQNQMQNKGSKLCLNSVLSSQLQQSLRFLHVSTMICSAVSLAQRLVPLSQTRQALTLSPAQSLVAQLAHFATRSHASAAKAITSLRGTSKHIDRRSGYNLSGGFSI